MESGGQKTPGSLLRIKVSCNRDRRLLEAVGRSCKGKEKGGRGEQTRRTNRKGRPLATSPDGQKKEIHAFCQEKILLHQRDTETNTREKGTIMNGADVPLRRLPVHHLPVMLTQYLHGVVGFSKPTATLPGCPAMGTCRRSEVGPRPGDPAPF